VAVWKVLKTPVATVRWSTESRSFEEDAHPILTLEQEEDGAQLHVIVNEEEYVLLIQRYDTYKETSWWPKEAVEELAKYLKKPTPLPEPKPEISYDPLLNPQMVGVPYDDDTTR
jgi:hypothetical protein